MQKKSLIKMEEQFSGFLIVAWDRRDKKKKMYLLDHLKESDVVMKKKCADQFFPALQWAGQKIWYMSWSNHINPRNFDVSVLCYCGKQNTSLEKKAEDKIDVHYADCAGTVTPQKIHTVFREINKIRPDVVHAHMGGVLYAALWTLKNRKPLVVTIHTTPQKAIFQSG